MERLKAITEDFLRLELRNAQPETYYVPEGKILTPAAREYLQQRKIKIAKGEPPEAAPAEPAAPAAPAPAAAPAAAAAPTAKYRDHETGAFYMEKPEHMTQLFGNELVTKNHPRILFRGKLDSLQAMVVLDQALIAADGNQKLVDDLGSILDNLREMMRCDVLDETYCRQTIIGLTHQELRERSHNPQKFFGIKQMLLPDYTMGRDYALLNQLRAAVRETEVAAATAFLTGSKCTRPDIMEELNRLSSALHIMMCMYLAGMYRKEDGRT
ncbi:ATP-binding protein [Flavonifractor sp. HCP28S3_F3]|uniref:ATP-binding protein n=1 Tax=Flavonifractor sp. HCP28S3_F3 TaxID=3438939 RepID=UPI003F8CF223